MRNGATSCGPTRLAAHQTKSRVRRPLCKDRHAAVITYRAQVDRPVDPP
jgi:hypothetical protein